jgi:hypothetical protein
MALELNHGELEWARNMLNDDTMQRVMADMEARSLNNALGASDDAKKMHYLDDISALRRLKSNLEQTLLEAAEKAKRASK